MGSAVFMRHTNYLQAQVVRRQIGEVPTFLGKIRCKHKETKTREECWGLTDTQMVLWEWTWDQTGQQGGWWSRGALLYQAAVVNLSSMRCKTFVIHSQSTFVWLEISVFFLPAALNFFSVDYVYK